MLPDPARDLPAERHRILKERFMEHIQDTTLTEPARAGTSASAPSRRRRRVLLPALVGGAMVVVLGVGSFIGLRLGDRTQGGTVVDPASPVAQLLEQAALVAYQDAVPLSIDKARNDQFVYVETYGGFANMAQNIDTGTMDVEPVRPHRRQIWLSVDGSRPALLREYGSSSVLEPQGGTSVNAPNLRFLQSLPTDPRDLLARIYHDTAGAGPNPDQEAFVTIGDLMRESIVPGPLAAALYRAAARIPGITIVPDAVNARGRHGVAVSRTFGGERTEWIFDPTSHRLLGERSVTTQNGSWGKAGFVIGTTAVVARGIVDRAGDLPS
jgi:hypothetical protein